MKTNIHWKQILAKSTPVFGKWSLEELVGMQCHDVWIKGTRRPHIYTCFAWVLKHQKPRLTLFGPAYFGVSTIWGGHIVPPLNIFGLGRVRVPIFFGNYFPRSDLPYTKGFMKFGCPEPSKKSLTFETFISQRGVCPGSQGSPLMKFCFFRRIWFFFSETR